MKHIKKFENYKNASVDIYGLKCDNPSCDYEDMTVPLSDYSKSIGKACPKCGENLLTQQDYDETMNLVQAVEIINLYSPEDLDKIAQNLSSEEIDNALDFMNKLKITKDVDFRDSQDSNIE